MTLAAPAGGNEMLSRQAILLVLVAGMCIKDAYIWIRYSLYWVC